MQRTALVVDDDVVVRRSLVRALRNIGWDSEAVSCEEDALECFQKTPPALALVDLFLERSYRDGLAVLRKGVEMAPRTSFVIMSGNVTLELAVEAMRLGATDVVAAPFDPREMVARWAATEPDPFLHLDAAESRHIRKVLGLCGGNITLAAERLRISRRGLQGKLQRLCGCTEPARGKS